jgi:hypothetical protein
MGGVLTGRVESIQDRQDSIDFDQRLAVVVEAFEPLPTSLAVLKVTLIPRFSLRQTS